MSLLLTLVLENIIVLGEIAPFLLAGIVFLSVLIYGATPVKKQ
jgi:hypothetical protein